MKPAPATPTTLESGSTSSPSRNRTAGQQFVVMALTMSWQLAIVVLVPVLGGVWVDKAAHTGTVFTLVGLGLALLGMGVVLWRTLQVANSLPVPKLTAAEKRAIQKQYEEDDKE